ncbi:hypothetical protein M2360_004947 [Rhizobium sp. SG_E_25_P2]|jgi:hypothetical protein|uniref:hypothetical protein n=1 Tax=Rhizobium sp. SG_E_25_P2 TaxID=2879942 RepID=UPI002476F62B|nr:hypothetical protein [Rhizobium sp. SG_E_25_P2]MDH6269519.1 hypothetical protein [Rhizobium sp. SG_E_25_P2]
MASDKNKPPFYLIDTTSEFYRPAVRRYAICASVAVWAGLEIYAWQPFWMVIAVALAAYCIYTLIIAYKPPQQAAPAPASTADDSDDGGADGDGSD